MANALKRALTSQVGVSPVTALAVPAATTVTIIGVSACNRTAGNVALDLYIDPPTGANVYVLDGVTIPPNDSYQQEMKLVLEAEDKLKAVADTASAVDLILSYLQQD